VGGWWGGVGFGGELGGFARRGGGGGGGGEGGGSADRPGHVGGEWSASRPGRLNSKEISPSPSALGEAGWVPQLARTQWPGCEIPSYAGSRILFVQLSASYRSNGSCHGSLP